jgi:ferredoxin
LKFQVEVDREKCAACGKCYTIDALHLERDEDGKARVRGGVLINGKSAGNFGDGKLILIHEAEFACPVGAIKIVWESELMPGYPTI